MELKYHVMIEEEQQGPFTEMALKNLLSEGKITSQSYAWKEGMDDWKPICEIAELHELAGAKNSTPPPPPKTPSITNNKKGNWQGPSELNGPKVIANKNGNTISLKSGKVRISGEKLQVIGKLVTKDLGYVSDIQRIIFIDQAKKNAEIHFSDNLFWKITDLENELERFAQAIERGLAQNLITYEIRKNTAGTIFGIIILLVIVFFVYNLFSEENTPGSSATTAQRQVISDSCAKVCSAFGTSSNLTSLQKEELWKMLDGKWVEWIARVSSIDTTFGTLQMQVKCQKYTLVSDAIISFDDDWKQTLLSLGKNQNVKFRAQLKGYGELLGMSLSNGELVK